MSLIDFTANLFRDPESARAFADDPGQALQQAGLPDATPAAVHSLLPTVAASMPLDHPLQSIIGAEDPQAALQNVMSGDFGQPPQADPAPMDNPSTDSVLWGDYDQSSHVDYNPVDTHGSTGSVVSDDYDQSSHVEYNAVDTHGGTGGVLPDDSSHVNYDAVDTHGATDSVLWGDYDQSTHGTFAAGEPVGHLPDTGADDAASAPSSDGLPGGDVFF
ncbi:IniB N-terminal domain-containing protein [Mycobacterium sp.]|uniref:IniB N-terminal domain-containing protein n=1 Tax=Mycobacterium sp. TaxID=1785 RepID=UPI002D507BAB|nr:IniB N-terminal domain-containing protein [Mycobacterium sp.]HZA09005.1 IniB N-terminal domain-containing protein [Mycobacterium sp.]